MTGHAYTGSDALTGITAVEAEASVLPGESPLHRRHHYLNGMWHETMISCNLRAALVENIARCYLCRGVELADLISEGNSGLSHALKNFESEGGSRFSSYAARCIRRYVERAIADRHEGSRIQALANHQSACATDN